MEFETFLELQPTRKALNLHSIISKPRYWSYFQEFTHIKTDQNSYYVRLSYMRIVFFLANRNYCELEYLSSLQDNNIFIYSYLHVALMSLAVWQVIEKSPKVSLWEGEERWRLLRHLDFTQWLLRLIFHKGIRVSWDLSCCLSRP